MALTTEACSSQLAAAVHVATRCSVRLAEQASPRNGALASHTTAANPLAGYDGHEQCSACPEASGDGHPDAKSSGPSPAAEDVCNLQTVHHGTCGDGLIDLQPSTLCHDIDPIAVVARSVVRHVVNIALRNCVMLLQTSLEAATAQVVDAEQTMTEWHAKCLDLQRSKSEHLEIVRAKMSRYASQPKKMSLPRLDEGNEEEDQDLTASSADLREVVSLAQALVDELASLRVQSEELKDWKEVQRWESHRPIDFIVGLLDEQKQPVVALNPCTASPSGSVNESLLRYPVLRFLSGAAKK
eukprot:CAMPEP_0115386726 /NCGR_PEP_ID=MMETSP0271-20121206/8292_1 /TAXON_ID=71861 /ORGANISM="Scrippsiella trochoidea, Strain CCMP3099" /LENGTH=297 /DNA_ID=CAMNT_0002810161 /DNA_START=693 /DNA_END=1587 /DNA_ORIENTATION=-